MATALDLRKGRGNAPKKKKKISPSKQRKSNQRKFHQVKVKSPFLLNKIMATSTTKQPRKAYFTTNYRIVEAGLLQS